MLDTVLQDLRFTIKALVRRPGYTFAAAGTLALGIAAGTSLFSVVNGVLLAPMRFPDAGQLVRLFETSPSVGRTEGNLTPATYYDIEASAKTLDAVAAYQSGWEYVVDLRDGAGARLVPGATVFPNTFALLGVPAAVGRSFLAEGSPDDDDGILISHAVWQGLFGGDPAVVGRAVDVQDAPHTVLGVMPEGFAFPDERVGVWTPYVLSAETRANRRSHMLKVVGRLSPDATVQRMQTELSGIMGRLRAQFPIDLVDADLQVVSLREATVGDVRPTLLALFASVLVLLAIACINVAALGVIRGWGRNREIAVRVALGASRQRVAWVVLTESLVLAVTAAVPGTLLGWWGTSLLLRLAPVHLPRQDAVTFDVRVLGFVLLMTTLVAVMIGLLPTLRAVPTRLMEGLKEGFRGSTVGRRFLLDVLVGAEVALSVILLLGAGLLIRSYANLRGVHPGFSSENVLAVSVLPTSASYPGVVAQTALYDRILDRVVALPGVSAAGVVTELPLSGPPNTWSLLRPGRETEDDHIGVHWNPASAGYFETVKLPLLRGRLFDRRDHADAQPVLVIDAATAQRFFGEDDPIGARVRTSPTSRWYTVVGVVGSVRHESLRADVQLTMYSPYAQMLESWRGSRWVLARTDGAPSALAPAVRQAMLDIDPRLATDRVGPFDDVIGGSLAMDQFRLFLLTTFATLALALAVIGLYGTLTHVVLSRARELAIRSALGASPRRIVGGVVSRAAMITIAGIAAGALVATALGGMLETALFGVTVLDPATQAGVALLVAGVAFLAALIPALRAASLPPAAVLRSD